jgi:HPt (histidine-containing phosphotransfer) domain-containing protein
MADSEFIELLGYSTINDILKSNISQNIKFENGKVYLTQNDKNIEANYTETELYTTTETIKMVKLSNIIETKKSSTLQLNYQPIYLNVEKISSEMGLGVDDYKLYLDSFIDQSIIDEKKLLLGDDKAIKNLSNLALTLKIPNINILLLKIKKLPKQERIYHIDEYYSKLALLTLKKPANYEESSASDIFELDTLSSEKKEEELNSKFTELLSNIEEPSIDTKKEEKLQNNFTELTKTVESKDDMIDLDLTLDLDDELLSLDKKPSSSTESIEVVETKEDVNKIALEQVKALPINYNPKTAADELNLPVVLIEEFVEDFIEQAHHDKDHLLASYYQKDMDNIHELGHKLKGAASNLRINELADVLEEIQFCTEHDKLEGLFIKYWGLFIGLEEYMQQPKQR